MLKLLSAYKYFILILIFLSSLILTLFYFALKPTERLPVFQPHDVNIKLVDSSVYWVKKYHTIAPFKLVNQNGDTITEQFYDDTIYVADFFFTSCPGICPVLTKNMNKVQEVFIDDPKVLLVSFSVTPNKDTPQVLKSYALKTGVNDEKWNLLTGDKKEIYTLARKSYFAVEPKANGKALDMIHSENFILIDKKKQIRGFYNGTKKADVEKLIKDIKLLKKTG